MNKHPKHGLLIVDPSRRERAEIPLLGVRIHARLTSQFSRVTVEQRYENRESSPVEAVYVFPLEEGSAVCGFAVTVGERRIVGATLPRDEAFDRYDDAMDEGHGAFLLDQERPNVFTASVGNVLPGQRVTVELSYLAELSREGDAVRLMIPTTVSPRYVPEHRLDFEGLTDAERVSPPVSVGGVPYDLELRVDADLLSPVRAVESPSHAIRTELDGSRAAVTLAGDDRALDRDFVLLLRLAEPQRPLSCFALDAEGDRYAMVTFTPPVAARRTPVDIVFVVDCSGSMDGRSIEEARRTLLRCLRSLAPGDCFEIVRFGSTYTRLFGRSEAYDDRTLERATEHVQGIEADLQGTEILAPLREILESPAAAGLPRRIVLLTDGQVANEDEVVALAREHRAGTRIFAFGIGAGASEHLVRGVARASGGAAEFVAPGETIDDKVLRHFDRITVGCADRVALAWEAVEVEDVTPAEVPAYAPGESISFMARVRAGTAGKAVLEGAFAGETFRQEVELAEASPTAGTDASFIPTLWARRRIRELEQGATGWRRGSQQTGRVVEQATKEIERLAVRHGLMSSATSYVAIEERPEGERATERAELRRIPVALTRGWGGIGQRAGLVVSAFRAAHVMECREAPGLPGGIRAMLRPPRVFLSRVLSGSGDFVGFDSLLLLQQADGSWDLSRRFARKLGLRFRALRKAASALGVADAERLVATLVAIDRLTRTSNATLYAPAVRKAREWVARVTAGVDVPGGFGSWEEWAADLLRSGPVRR